MRRPPAEVDVDAALVRQLLDEQCADLHGADVTFLGEGWDATSWRVGDRLVARLPRRALGAAGLELEQRWLPVLAPSLSLPVPVPVHLGTPARGFPWPWSLVPYLDGVPALERPPLDGDRVAASLARFWRSLHVVAPRDAPTSALRGAPLAVRSGDVERLVGELDGTVDVTAARRAWQEGLAAPVATRRVWVHGDPHPGNLLVADGDLRGVLDFQDLNAGDPATDLAGAWLLLEPEDLATALGRYGADAALVARARAWAALFALLFVALADEHRGLAAVGHATLRRL